MSQSHTERPSSYLQTLGNGLAILNLLRDGPATITEVARWLGVTRSSAYRLIATLATHGFVRALPGDTYSLGTTLWHLGVASLGAMDRVRTVAEPEIKKLAAACGESAHLAIYEDGSVVYVATAEGSSPIRASVEVGRRAPAYCVATGKAILAHQGRDEWESVAQDGLVGYTDATITSAEKLFSELEDIRSGAVALNRGEWRDGVGGCARPMRVSADGAIAAIGFSGPTERIMARLSDLTRFLDDAVARISHELSAVTGEEGP